ncbi:MAG: hypothetical protein K2P87_00615 [Lachnospiraceae bacterium]|nr:hypothetical protein [Lachnospiraceae bacterium]
MSALKQEAVKIIETMREDVMVQVIAYLQHVASETQQPPKPLDGFRVLQSFAGSLPEDFDYKKELEEARDEKINRLS